MVMLHAAMLRIILPKGFAKRRSMSLYMHHVVNIRGDMQRGLDTISKTEHSIERTRGLTHIRPRMSALALAMPSQIAENISICHESSGQGVGP